MAKEAERGVEKQGGLGLGIEQRSIDYVPEDERHGKVWHQGPFWFLGNFQFFTILALAALWTVVSLAISANAIATLSSTLIMMLYLLAPWTAVNLVDYFFVRHGRYAITDLFITDGLYGTWGSRGISAFLLGFIASVPFFVLPNIWTGPLGNVLQGVDVAWLVGLVVSGGSYYLLTRSLDVGSERRKVQASEQALEGHDTSTAPSV